MTEENQNATQPQPPAGPQFALQRVYVKDISLETPNSPHIFLEQWQPQMNLDLSIAAQDLGEDHHEVTLTLTVTVKIGEKTAFLIEVNQAGVFIIKGTSNEQMSALINIACPNILFPYAREVVSDLVGRGSFPQVLLQPINFELLHAERVKQMKAQQQSGDPSH